MDNAQFGVLVIIGLCIGFVLILRAMFKWNSKLTKQVAALTAEREELQRVIQEQTTSANQARQIISELETRNEQLAAEIQSLSRFSHIRDTTLELERLTGIIARNDEEAKERVLKLMADANREAGLITEKANIYAETLKRETNADAKAKREKLQATIDEANTQAAAIISKAQQNAEDVAGDAYRALKEADRLEVVIEALKNTLPQRSSCHSCFQC